MGEHLFEFWLITVPTLLLGVVTFADAFKDYKIMKMLVGLLGKTVSRRKVVYVPKHQEHHGHEAPEPESK